MANKKDDVATSLANIKRGSGLQLSTDAETQQRTEAAMQQRTPAKPPKDWVSKGVEWRPKQHRALKVLAAQRGKEFREILEEVIGEYLAAHKLEIASDGD